MTRSSSQSSPIIMTPWKRNPLSSVANVTWFSRRKEIISTTSYLRLFTSIANNVSNVPAQQRSWNSSPPRLSAHTGIKTTQICTANTVIGVSPNQLKPFSTSKDSIIIPASCAASMPSPRSSYSKRTEGAPSTRTHAPMLTPDSWTLYHLNSMSTTFPTIMRPSKSIHTALNIKSSRRRMICASRLIQDD